METPMPARFSSPLAKPADVFRLPCATIASDIMALPFHVRKRWSPKPAVIPDYTNQLDLFSEAPIDTQAPVASESAHPSGVSHARPRPPQQLDFGALDPLPPDDADRTPAAKPAPADPGGDGGEVRRSPVRPGVGAQDGTPPGVGIGDKRDSPAGRVTLELEPEEKPSRDFRITDAHRIRQAGLHEKARDNIAAIRLLKTLEAENRDATGDEKSVLARYVGWGGMPNVFGYYPPDEWRSTA